MINNTLKIGIKNGINLKNTLQTFPKQLPQKNTTQ